MLNNYIRVFDSPCLATYLAFPFLPGWGTNTLTLDLRHFACLSQPECLSQPISTRCSFLASSSAQNFCSRKLTILSPLKLSCFSIRSAFANVVPVFLRLPRLQQELMIVFLVILSNNSFTHCLTNIYTFLKTWAKLCLSYESLQDSASLSHFLSAFIELFI